MVRDPRDAIVSNYFQVTRRDRWFDGDIAGYVRWPRGSVRSMLRYYDVWARQRDVPADFLLLRYEDLRRDTVGELRRVAAFIGLDGIRQEAIEQTVAHATFDAMRRREAAQNADASPLAPGHAADPESFKARKGEVGGYAAYLAADDVAWIDARIDEGLDPYYGYGSSRAADASR